MIKCNVCESDVSSILIQKGGYDVYQCSECGLAFTYPQPSSLDEQYDSSYFDLYKRRRPFRINRSNNRLKVIELIKEPGRLLDIGCSLGYFVEAARDKGWKASGLEISEFASGEARKSGLDVRTGILDSSTYPEKSFDCVTMWDVLEHVPDPTDHMRNVNSILLDNGLVVIGTPNLAHIMFKIKKDKWRHLKPWEHIYYFQVSSMKKLLEKTGFKMINPPLLGGREFSGSLGAKVRSFGSRIIKPNDVITFYGVKNVF